MVEIQFKSLNLFWGRTQTITSKFERIDWAQKPIKWKQEESHRYTDTLNMGYQSMFFIRFGKE